MTQVGYVWPNAWSYLPFHETTVNRSYCTEPNEPDSINRRKINRGSPSMLVEAVPAGNPSPSFRRPCCRSSRQLGSVPPPDPIRLLGGIDAVAAPGPRWWSCSGDDHP